MVADAVGFDFFLKGEPDETVEAVEVEAFEVFAAPKKDDGSLGIRRCFKIAFTITSFFVLELGHNFGGSSCCAKMVSTACVLRNSSLNSALYDMLSVSVQFRSRQIWGHKRSFKLKITFGFFGSPNFIFIALVALIVVPSHSVDVDCRATDKTITVQ
jgi:hypothetical protein